MKENMCSICGELGLEKFYNNLIFVCKHCGHGITNNTKVYDLVKKRAPIHRFGYFGEFILKILNYGRCIDILARVRKKYGTILDSGCGRGEIVRFFNRLGWKSIGTELNDQTAIDARRSGARIVTSDEFPKFVLNNAGIFDLISSFHNLEHINDSILFISDCKKLLNANGSLLIEVPNFSSLQSVLAKENWLLLDSQNHFHHFTKKSLSFLLTKNGFRCEFLTTWSLKFGPIGMLFTFLSRNSNLMRILKFEDLSQIKFGFLFPIRFLLIALLLPISFLVELFAAAIGRGSILRVIATKSY